MDNVGQSGPVAEMAHSDEAPIIIVAHQIGSGADGGLQSLSEIISATPWIKKVIVTNRDGDFAARWRVHAEVLIWNMEEPIYSRGRRRNLRQLARRYANRFRNSWKMAKLINRLDAKLVHFNESSSFWNCILGAKLTRRKIILNVRDTIRTGSSTSKWKLALYLCDSFLVLSKEMQISWQSVLAPFSLRPSQKKKFQYIYSMVDLEKFSAVQSAERLGLRKKLNVRPDQFEIGYIARVEDKKNQLNFIKNALPLLRSRINNVHLTFVGDFKPEKDSYAAACLAEVRRQNAEGVVRFVGYSADIVDWYQAVDVLLLASRREGLPRCMIEGLACGAPIVSFDVCSVREVLEEHQCGLVVPGEDYMALANAVAHLDLNSQFRQELRQRGPHIARRLFSSIESARHYAELIANMSATSGQMDVSRGLAE